MSQKNKDNAKQILIVIVVIGLVIRVVLSVGLYINEFQYDIGICVDRNALYDNNSYNRFFEFDRSYLEEGGHLEYILTIYNTRTFAKFKL